MKYTNNYNLKKPEQTDYISIDILNENMDILDSTVGGIEVPVKSVNDKTGNVTITKSDINLSNVTNKEQLGKTEKAADSSKLDGNTLAQVRAGVTKSDVGLSNVTNDKQMPINGGVLENYREKITTISASGGTINLNNGNVFVHTPTGNITYFISNAASGGHSFTLIINMGSTLRTLTFPSSVKWRDGELPVISGADRTYLLTFLTIDGGNTWLGLFGGEF